MKFIFTLILLTVGLLAQAQIPSYVPTNGLVGWWPFNGNANDESGNGNHGMVNGATLAADRFGNTGKAYSFSGSYSNTQTITGSCSSFPSGNNPRSIVLWYKANNLGNGMQQLLGYGGNGCGESFILNFENTDIGSNYLGKIEIQGHCLNFRTFSNYPTPANGVWHQVAFSFDGSIFSFFQNGILTYQSGPKALNTIVFNKIFCFGKQTDESGNSPYINASWQGFNGLLDDIAIYNRALSAVEVQQLYLGCQTQPTFTAQPQNKSVAQGQTTTFAVQVDSASSFQWQMDNGFGFVNLVNSSLFSGVGTSSLTVKGSNSIDGYAFRCIATSCNADTSNAATLTVTSSASAAAGTVAGVPGLINYQGSALDSLGKPMKNQTISLKLSVLDSSSSGTAVYVESHSTATNGSGHFAIQIGGGTAILGTFDSVGWANGRNKYLKTELSQNGTWVNLGTSQLVSVPYALHAGSAEVAKTATRAFEIMDSAGNVFSVGYSNGQPTLVPVPGSGSASNPGSFACGQAVNYAGESYPTVQIGTQCWFQKNLNVGTMILGANDQTNNNTLEKYCYNNDTANCAIYGGLYQWAEAVQYQNGASNTTSPSPAFSGNVKGICPIGWHVPSDGEWCTLTTFLDSNANCGVFGTSSTIAGSFQTIFYSGYRSTSRNPNIFFGGNGNTSIFWSTTEINNWGFIQSIVRQFFNNNGNLDRSGGNMDAGFSVRCLKD
jgi:uncharacterized protein (TIGR02145 family)